VSIHTCVRVELDNRELDNRLRFQEKKNDTPTVLCSTSNDIFFWNNTCVCNMYVRYLMCLYTHVSVCNTYVLDI